MKNVFVISSGRTATTTFAQAASHLPGWTADHETRVSLPLADRVDYPEHHIEADNRLLFYLPQLETRFGDDALYVYLVRDPEKIAQSYAKRWHLTVSVVRAYTHGLRMIPRVSEDDVLSHCRDFVAYADQTFRAFLDRQTNVQFFDIEDAETEFTAFARHLGLDAPEAALAVWRETHNANPPASAVTRLKRRFRLAFP